MNRPFWFYAGMGVAVILVLILYGLFAYSPLVKKAAEQRARLASQQKELETARYLVAHYDEFTERANQLRWEQERLEERFPAEPRIPELLKSVTAVATECNIQDLEFMPQPIVEHENYFEQPIKITITCNYHALGTFISHLAKLSRLVNAQEVQVIGRDKTGQTLSLTAKLTLVTYVRKNP